MRRSIFTYKNDRQMVEALMSGNEGAVHYVFFDHYKALLLSNARKAAFGIMDADDLVQELYIYLSENNWERLRHYDASMSFVCWFSVVSYRYFKKISCRMIDSASEMTISEMNDHDATMASEQESQCGLLFELHRILPSFEPPRDREVLQASLLNGEEPASLAKRLGVTVDNLYNIKRRALARLVKNYLTGYDD